MKLLRTIRFDASDTAVFDVAAAEGEWAVSGAFVFANDDPTGFKGKTKQAFANGFLGVPSFGRSTFAIVGDAKDEEMGELAYHLARNFVERCGAPSIDAALPVANEEVAFAAGLAADQPVNTVLTVRRTVSADGGIKEEFRTIRPPSGERMHARVWTFESDDA